MRVVENGNIEIINEGSKVHSTRETRKEKQERTG